MSDTADSKRKQRKRRNVAYKYRGGQVNRDPLPRRALEQQVGKNPEAPIVTSKRWIDYP